MKPAFEGIRLQSFVSHSLALARRVSLPEHLANPFLNIINTTPNLCRQYPDLLGKRTVFWRLCHSLAGAINTLLRTFLHSNQNFTLSTPEECADVLLISHLTNVAQLKQSNDFYYGELANNLREAGISTHTVLINHCRAGAESVTKSCRTNTTILPAFQTTSTEFINIMRLIKAARTIPTTQMFIPNDRFIRLAKAAQFGNRAIGDLRIGQMLSKFISAMQPRVVMHTFEGHGWEKILAAASHALPCPAHVIGYQHAVLFPGDKTLYHHNGSGTIPDHIFTTGDVTRRLLSSKLTFYNTQVSTLGSIKRKSKLPKPKFSAKGTCLFAPEGTLDEVRLMARFAIDTAKAHPSNEFTLRLHP